MGLYTLLNFEPMKSLEKRSVVVEFGDLKTA